MGALTIDPASLLPTGGFHRDGVPEPVLPRLVEIEARGEDASALPALARTEIGENSGADAYQLTARERDVVRLLCSGYSRAEIAKSLTVSAHTIDDHVKRVFGKVGVRSRAELTAKFFSTRPFTHQHRSPVGAAGWFLH